MKRSGEMAAEYLDSRVSYYIMWFYKTIERMCTILFNRFLLE